MTSKIVKRMITEINGHIDLTLDKELLINGLFKKTFTISFFSIWVVNFYLKDEG